MSNLRLTTLVPDEIVGSTISLPGILSVTKFQSTSTDDATSASSGSVVFSGGLALGKTLQIGGDHITFAGSSLINFIAQNTSNKTLVLCAASSTSTGAALELNGNAVASGSATLTVGSAGSMVMKHGASTTIQFDPTTVTINHTTSTTNSTTGALVLSAGGLAIGATADAVSTTHGGSLTVAGGMALAKSVFIGGSCSLTGALTVADTTDATTISSASCVLAGGLAVGKSVLVDGHVTTAGTFTVNNTSDTSISTTGSLSIARNTLVNGNSTVVGNSTTGGMVSVTSTSESVSLSTGSIVTAGGLAVAKQCRVGGTLTVSNDLSVSGTSLCAGLATFTDTTDATVLNTGSVVLAGGISVAKNAVFGAAVTITGATVLSSVTIDSATTNTIAIVATTASTSATTGALTVAGGVGITGSLTIAGTAVFSNTTDATSISTGSIVVAGGCGITGSVWIGSSIQVASTANFGATTTTLLTSTGLVNFSNTTDAMSINNASTTLAGGLGVAKSFFLGGSLSVATNATVSGTLNVAGLVTFTNTTDVTSTTVASIILSGGLLVNKATRMRGTATIDGTTVHHAAVYILDTTDAVSAGTGSVVVSGGMGIQKNLFCNGIAQIAGATLLSSTLVVNDVTTLSCTTDSSSTTTGALVVAGGIGIVKNCTVGQQFHVSGSSSFSDTVTLYANGIVFNTTDSNDSTTGAFTVAGGLGVAKSLNIGGDVGITGTTGILGTLSVLDNTDSTTVTTGAITVNGGIGVARNITIGGNLAVATNATITGSLTINSGTIICGSMVVADNSGMTLIVSPAPSLRIAANNSVKASTYSNAIDLFTLGNTYVDTNHETLQLTNVGTTIYAIRSRAFGTGTARNLVLYAGSSNSTQLVLAASTGVVSIGTTLDSTTPITGSLTIAGGLGVNANISIRGAVQWFSTAGGNNHIAVAAPATITNTYTLTLPPALPSNASVLVVDAAGTLGYSTRISASGSFYGNTAGFSVVTESTELGLTVSSTGAITCNCTTDASSSATAAWMVQGGAGITKSLIVGAQASIASGGALFTGNTTNTNTALKCIAGGSAGAATGAGISLDATTVGGHNWVMQSLDNQNYTLINETTNTVAFTVHASNSLLQCTRISATEFITAHPTNAYTISWTSPSDLAASYAMVLPKALPTNSLKQYALITDIQGNLSFSEVVGNAGGSTNNINNNLSFSQTFAGANNQTTPTPITGLVMPGVTLFALYILVTLESTIPENSVAALYLLEGVRRVNESEGWDMQQSLRGPFFAGTVFSIETSGQINYTSTNTPGFTSLIFDFSPYTAPTNYLYYHASNNQTTPTPVSGLTMTEPAFSQFILVTIVSVIPENCKRAMVRCEGVRQYDNTYSMQQVTTGAARVGIAFTISPTTNQIEYTSTYTAGWVSTTFQFDPPYNALNNAIYTTVHIEGQLELLGATSGVVAVTAPNTVTEAYTLTLPSQGPPDTDNNYALVSQSNGQLGWTALPATTPTFFSAANNIASPTLVPDLVFTGPQCVRYVVVQVTADDAFNANFLLEGVEQPNGGGWELVQTIRGGPSNTGVAFSIASNGQIYYTSTNFSNWVSTVFEWYPVATPVHTNGAFADVVVTNTTEAYTAASGCAVIHGGLGVMKSVVSNLGFVTHANAWQYGVWQLNSAFTIDSSGNQIVPATQWTLMEGHSLNFTPTNFLIVPQKGVYSFIWNIVSNTTGIVAWFSVKRNETGEGTVGPLLPRCGYTHMTGLAGTVQWTGVLNANDTLACVLGAPAATQLLPVTGGAGGGVNGTLGPVGTTLCATLLTRLF